MLKKIRQQKSLNFSWVATDFRILIFLDSSLIKKEFPWPNKNKWLQALTASDFFQKKIDIKWKCEK